MFKKTIQARLYLNAAQLQHLSQVFGVIRATKNRILWEIKNEWEAHLLNPTMNPKPELNYFSLKKRRTKYRNDPETPWMRIPAAQAQGEAIKDVAFAFSNFFKQFSAYPRYYKKDSRQTVRYTEQVSFIENGKLRLVNCPGWIKMRCTEDLSQFKRYGVTIVKERSGKINAYFQVDFIPTVTSGKAVIGIDLGLKTYATISDGTLVTEIKPPQYYRQA